jgi:hypothetical protein
MSKGRPLLMDMIQSLYIPFESGIFFTNEEYNLDTFETTNSTSKPSKELMNKELSIFQGYEIDAKDIKYLLQIVGET